MLLRTALLPLTHKLLLDTLQTVVYNAKHTGNGGFRITLGFLKGTHPRPRLSPAAHSTVLSARSQGVQLNPLNKHTSIA